MSTKEIARNTRISVKKTRESAKKLCDETANANSWLETYYANDKNATIISRRLRQLTEIIYGMSIDLEHEFETFLKNETEE